MVVLFLVSLLQSTFCIASHFIHCAQLSSSQNTPTHSAIHSPFFFSFYFVSYHFRSYNINRYLLFRIIGFFCTASIVYGASLAIYLVVLLVFSSIKTITIDIQFLNETIISACSHDLQYTFIELCRCSFIKSILSLASKKN